MSFNRLIGVSIFLLGLSSSMAAGQGGSESRLENQVSANEVELSVDQEQLYQDIAGNLRCPTCVGVSVLDSSAGFSEQIKSSVKRQIQEGKTADSITEFFVDRYGPWILRAPPKEGFDLLAWLVPLILLILGPVVIWIAIWRRKHAFDTQGVRATEAILEEMELALQTLKSKRGN